MKIIIVFALIAIAFAANEATTKEEQDKIVQEYIKKCGSEIKITEEELSQLKDGTFDNGKEDLRCFINCFLEEAEIMKGGEFQKEIAIKKFSVRMGKEAAEKAVILCGDELQKEGAKCEPASKLFTCLLKNGLN